MKSSIWTYERFKKAFASEECQIDFYDNEISVETVIPADYVPSEYVSEEFQDNEHLSLNFSIDMPSMHPCVYISETKDDADDKVLNYEDDKCALKAFSDVMKEKTGTELYLYWYRQTANDRPAYRKWTTDEDEYIRAFQLYMYGKRPLCKSREDIFTILDALIEKQMDIIIQNLGSETYAGEIIDSMLELKAQVIENGLPSISETDMHYSVVISREDISVCLNHYYFNDVLDRILSATFPSSDTTRLPVLNTAPIYTVKFRLLSCAEFAKRCGVSSATIRQWIRRGKLRAAVRIGRDWMLPVTTQPPENGFSPAEYKIVKSIPREICEKHPFFSKFSKSETIRISEGSNGHYKLSRSLRDNDENQIELTKDEREKMELLLLQSDWAKYYTKDIVYATKFDDAAAANPLDKKDSENAH